ncbi:TPA: hypothetical protein I8034_002890 [Legionella pneumophila]|nr:P-loop NTPase fold protein [Legionella pneumophila subsp. fraseri]HAT1773479.1 hypothetical protein [Legionella pneumophila]MDX1847673.1 P-loop NTPase fold protein [Legionella pneumophila subsp. fraseri]HAT2128230.1 hypothetical protein [Legionella pneumophila]HAT2137381.1 hypothetical protein [Legionella pneumophila]
MERAINFILIALGTYLLLLLFTDYYSALNYFFKFKLILGLILVISFYLYVPRILDFFSYKSVKNFARYVKIEWVNGITLGILAFLIYANYISVNNVTTLSKSLILFAVIQFGFFYEPKKVIHKEKPYPSSNAFFSLIKSQPIINKTDDKLNVTRWVDKIKDLLLSYSGLTLVIGINGRWGIGKTSLINLISNELPQQNVLQFSSWDYLNADNLTEHLLNNIGKQLDKITGRIGLFSKLFNSLYVSVSFSPDKGMNFIYKLIFNFHSKNLKDKIKSRLENELNIPLIVFIDDLDRMGRKSFLKVVKSIHLLSDLPKIRFVLAYDKAHVLRLLFSENEHNKSIDFFSKLVNFEFNLNVQPEESRKEFCINIINEYKRGSEVDSLLTFIKDDPCSYHIFKLLITPREIRKILAFSLWAIFDEKGEANFNLVDMFILSVIQYREPKIYKYLQQNAEEIKNKLCSNLKLKPFNYAVSIEENKKYIENMNKNKSNKQDKNELLASLFGLESNNAQQETTSALIDFLFPPIFKAQSNLDELLKSKRMCHPAVFESYLNLESQSFSIEYIKLVDAFYSIDCKDIEGYGKFILKYRTLFLEHTLWEDFIRYNLLELDISILESFVKGIFRISKDFETDDYHYLNSEAELYSRRICHLIAGLLINKYEHKKLLALLSEVKESNPSYGVYSFVIHSMINPSDELFNKGLNLDESTKSTFEEILSKHAEQYFFKEATSIKKHDFCGLVFWTPWNNILNEKTVALLRNKPEPYLFWLLDFFVRFSFSNAQFLDDRIGFNIVSEIIKSIENKNDLSDEKKQLIDNFEKQLAKISGE